MSRLNDRTRGGPHNDNMLQADPSRTLPKMVCSLLSLILSIGLCSCGRGSSNSTSSNTNETLSGNWQFSLTPAENAPYVGVLSPVCQPLTQGLATNEVPFCMGGFLLSNQEAITGQLSYAVQAISTGSICNSGSAQVTGTVNGQRVSVTVVAGIQTFTLSGTLSADGTTMGGTYTTTAGTYGSATGPQTCGTAQTELPWTATVVAPLTGSVQGYFHSTFPPLNPLVNQEFQVTGSLIQGPNKGANSASVTGTLNFQGYPCLNIASVNGQISGSSVILQLIAPNGLNIGSIGTPPATSGYPAAVALQSVVGGGYILQGENGYGVSTSACPASATFPGDVGNICLAVGSSTACKRVLFLTQAFLTFPAQTLGSAATSQTVKITNMGSSALNNLQLLPTGNNFTPSDFDGVPNYTEADNCSSTPGATFSLAPQQSCSLTMQFSPQESCPWQPLSVGAGSFASPSQCPPFQPVRPVQVSAPPALTANVKLTCPSCTAVTDDSNPEFVIPITGIGTSAIQPSVPELDFGPEDASLNEMSEPQSVTFTNQSNSPIQILPAMTAPPCGKLGFAVTLPRPATPGSVPGLQVVQGLPNPPSLTSSSQTITYACDLDQQSQKPNFQIVLDDCSGTLLNPQQSCSLSIIYAPQPLEAAGGLDYFLQLSTLQCTSTTKADCEINSGRFPVELKSGFASPLRLSVAGLNFGTWLSGETSFPPLTITLSNDKNVANSQSINFAAIVTKGDYTEVDNCGFLSGIPFPPGSSCTMNITFSPKITGFDQGSITLTYSAGPTSGPLSQVIGLRGFGQ